MPNKETRIRDYRQHYGASWDLTTVLQNHPGGAAIDDLDECDLADEDVGRGGRDRGGAGQ